MIEFLWILNWASGASLIVRPSTPLASIPTPGDRIPVKNIYVIRTVLNPETRQPMKEVNDGMENVDLEGNYADFNIPPEGPWAIGELRHGSQMYNLLMEASSGITLATSLPTK